MRPRSTSSVTSSVQDEFHDAAQHTPTARDERAAASSGLASAPLPPSSHLDPHVVISAPPSDARVGASSPVPSNTSLRSASPVSNPAVARRSPSFGQLYSSTSSHNAPRLAPPDRRNSFGPSIRLRRQPSTSGDGGLPTIPAVIEESEDSVVRNRRRSSSDPQRPMAGFGGTSPQSAASYRAFSRAELPDIDEIISPANPETQDAGRSFRGSTDSAGSFPTGRVRSGSMLSSLGRTRNHRGSGTPSFRDGAPETEYEDTLVQILDLVGE